jgi:hypothetical protein
VPDEPRQTGGVAPDAGPRLALDAAIVLGIATTAMPFAGDLEAEAERWLRVLRLHGEAGVLLQALGVSEMPLPELQEEGADGQSRHQDSGRDTVGWVSRRAVQIARERGAVLVGTTDVLEAVMHVYGTEFDHVLRRHGTDRDEVIERLAAHASHPAGARAAT